MQAFRTTSHLKFWLTTQIILAQQYTLKQPFIRSPFNSRLHHKLNPFVWPLEVSGATVTGVYPDGMKVNYIVLLTAESRANLPHCVARVHYLKIYKHVKEINLSCNLNVKNCTVSNGGPTQSR